jgi:anti-sigma regulatory factor (Ser/Thr protein kinase)
MEDLSLHILDIAENSVAAKAERIEIRIAEDEKNDLLSLEIIDNGIGMDEETVKKALDPFYTSKMVRRVGLGLSLLSESAKAANGKLTIESEQGKGTRVRAEFQFSHIDRKPLGDIDLTIITLVMGNPDVDFYYEIKKNNHTHSVDTRTIRADHKDSPLNSLEEIKLLKEKLKKTSDWI